jgi:hypothetical protein
VILRALVSLLSVTPPWIAGRYSPELTAHLRRNALLYERVIAIGEASAVYRRKVRGNWHWDKANVLTVSTRSARSTARTASDAVRLGFEYVTSRGYERSVGRRMDSVSVTSEDELARWHTIASSWRAQKLTVLPSAVPVGEQVQLEDEPVTIAWLGTLSYLPNRNGLVRFLEAAGPHLRRCGVRLRVIGSGCPKDLEDQLTDLDYVDYRGYVEDLFEGLDGVTAAVVPVWEGAGIKMKTLTLLGYGIPVLSTTCGAEGIAPLAFLLVTDDVDTLAQACCEVSLTSDLVEQATRGRKICLEQHSSAAFHRAAKAAFSDGCMTPATADPRQN